MQNTMMLHLTLSLLLISAYLDINNADSNSVIRSIPKTCKHTNETEAARKLNIICRDCASLFDSDRVGKLCRQNCFSGLYLPACVKVLYFWDEKDVYKEMAEKLSGNKFAIWNDKTVELEKATEPSVFDSITVVHIVTAVIINVLLSHGITIFRNTNV